jgi:tRNA1Val (adenine37-N6)-methyltransferase
LLSKNGKALAAIPAFNYTIFESLARLQNLFVVNVLEITATSGKPPYLVLVQLEKAERKSEKSAIQIQDNAGQFTMAYRNLTKDFYLKF